MKAWRYQPSAGRYKNRNAARRAGSVNRNSWFAGGSRLLRALIKRQVSPKSRGACFLPLRISR